MNEISPIRIANVYGEQFGRSYGGNLWGIDGIAPTLKSSGSKGQEFVIEIQEVKHGIHNDFRTTKR